MNMKELAKNFKRDNKKFIEDNKTDKIMLNLEWTYYLDSLCKDRKITNKQWQNHSNIF